MRRREGVPHVLDRPRRRRRPDRPRVMLLGRDDALERLLRDRRARPARHAHGSGRDRQDDPRPRAPSIGCAPMAARRGSSMPCTSIGPPTSCPRSSPALELAPGPVSDQVGARRLPRPGARRGWSSTTSRTSSRTTSRRCSMHGSRRHPALHILATSRIPIGGSPARCRSASRASTLPSGRCPRTPSRRRPPVPSSCSGRGRSGEPLDIDEASARELAAILRLLDGMPLAIELAAGRTRVLALGDLRRRLGDPTTLEGPRDADPRHRSLVDGPGVVDRPARPRSSAPCSMPPPCARVRSTSRCSRRSRRTRRLCPRSTCWCPRVS